MKYLVTGSEGWIGSHLSNLITSTGNQVIRFDLKLGHDIIDDYELCKAIIDCDVVYHLAGETGVQRSWFDPYVYYRNNTLGSAHVFKTALEMGKKVVYASTGEVKVGNSPYAASKIGAEAAAKTSVTKGGDVVMLRILNPYGVGQPDSYIIPKFMKLAQENKPITIHGTGEQRKDYIYISDVVAAFWEAKALPGGTITDLGCGETKSIKEIAEDVIKITNSKSELKFIPSPRPGELSKVEGDLLQLFNINWKPQVSWQEGLEYVRQSI